MSTGKIISLTSAFICFLHYLGIYNNAQGHGAIHEQIVEITEQIEKDSTDALLYLKRGELYRYHREWDAALADYERAARLDPELDEIDLGRGKTMYQAGWYDRAKPVLDRFLAKQPGNVEALLTRGRVLTHLGGNLAAAEDFTQAIRHASEPTPEVYIERARALSNAGRDHIPDAIRGLDEGLARLGQIVTLQLYAIELNLNLGDTDAALQRLELISQQAPRKEKWLFRRGEILRQAGRLQAARDSFVQALDLIASLAPRVRNLKTTAVLEGRIRAALAEVMRQQTLENSNGS
ncbi:MAG: tetratricopeptide repeat protein [bacterium]